MPVSWLGVLLQESHLQLCQSSLIEKKTTHFQKLKRCRDSWIDVGSWLTQFTLKGMTLLADKVHKKNQKVNGYVCQTFLHK